MELNLFEHDEQKARDKKNQLSLENYHSMSHPSLLGNLIDE